MKPTVGRIVHYVSHGTPGGEYPKACRAALVTDVHGSDASGDVVTLAVFSPNGMLFAPRCAEGDALHGEHPPGAYGGTWHWPEREGASDA